MREFVGTENQVRAQQRLRDRQPWIARTPALANGARILHFVEPERLGWESVAQLALEDGLVGFPCVPEQETLADIRTHLGTQWKTSVWRAYIGSPEAVLPACEDQIRAVALPDGWRIDLLESPSRDQIGAVQALNEETGVSPYPAYYSRGAAVPVLTVCISDATGCLAATASAAFRYHAESRLAGCVFAGMVSVAEGQRGRGLGRLVNAIMLKESQARFGWTLAKEQVAADNPASRAMIEACGLNNDDGYVSIAAINSEESFTR